MQEIQNNDNLRR